MTEKYPDSNLTGDVMEWTSESDRGNDSDDSYDIMDFSGIEKNRIVTVNEQIMNEKKEKEREAKKEQKKKLQ